MSNKVLPLIAGVFLVSIAGCKCGPGVKNVTPSLKISPPKLDFGQVKLGTTSTLTLTFEAQTQAAVNISSLKLTNGLAAGGAEAFKLQTMPSSVDSLGMVKVKVDFKPTVLEDYTANLAVASDDPDHPTITVSLQGTGAKPVIQVTPECDAARSCTGTVVVTPPSIDFGAQPYMALIQPDPTTLPQVDIVNAGAVDLTVTSLTITGADAAAFVIQGNSSGSMTFSPNQGVNVPIKFAPTSDSQQTWAAVLTIASDDTDNPSITIPLTGTLRPNLPPVVCLNLVKVAPLNDLLKDYTTDWPNQLVPPAAGYDFTANRDVEPRAEAEFSAISDSTSMTACTFDPEDGRAGLTYNWTLISAPVGATGLGLSGATTADVKLRPIILGEYVLQLVVSDAEGHMTTTTAKFDVAVKQDLVAQLTWAGFPGIDLDLHLVRPSAVVASGDPFSGAFDFFQSGPANKTSGDLNGYARLVQQNNAGFDFDWGGPGTSDDPTLNFDDTGSGPLIENLSLNHPENDPLCDGDAGSSCAYKLMVHYYQDSRNPMIPPPCFIDGGVDADGGRCLDGEACNCTGGQACVADGVVVGDAGYGIGKCYTPPQPVLKIFLKGSAIAAAEVPLSTLVPPDQLTLGAPCEMLYLADVNWPSKNLIGSLPDGGTPPPTISVKGADGTGRIVNAFKGRFGYRPAGGGLACVNDTTLGNNVKWYTEQPR
ncbi:MAG: choice-of-anchor D domain-containing protein [Myxococcaceae bacterium]